MAAVLVLVRVVAAPEVGKRNQQLTPTITYKPMPSIDTFDASNPVVIAPVHHQNKTRTVAPLIAIPFLLLSSFHPVS